MPLPSDAPPVGRSLLRDDVYRRLRDAIVDGTLRPGEQLRDAEIGAWLGVSRTPVREALLRLEGNGLVVTQPGRSTAVSEIDEKSLRDARDVVAAMHTLAVQEVAGRLSADDIAGMRDANRRFAEAIRAGDAAAALDSDEELHAIPIRVLGNRAVEKVLEQFGPLVRRAELIRFSDDGHASIERHERMIDLCERHDGAGAAAAAFATWQSLPTSTESR
ncbi:GntR family transcriptional regulator [Microbacterium sp. TNHR37B]|uniref:GntR family transcriptional regulator n=1 Tax=Microbacterium sp. TNHR37B TaxID=1775956 RepID=UPI0007B2495A|nr:GntR family transcriptional regulator [Microbacterium sp. TNHR37B]KZE89149.1 HTH-type transcriptional repressor RspR [Microbacterium sp. TNHR37B]